MTKQLGKYRPSKLIKSDQKWLQRRKDAIEMARLTAQAFLHTQTVDTYLAVISAFNVAAEFFPLPATYVNYQQRSRIFVECLPNSRLLDETDK